MPLMKKALILLGIYLVATLVGGLLGVAVWPEPSRLSDLAGFLIVAPLLQLVAAMSSLSGTAAPSYTGEQPLPYLLLFVCLLLMIVSMTWYWRSEKRCPLLVFGLSVVCLSLPGTNLLYAAMAF